MINNISNIIVNYLDKNNVLKEEKDIYIHGARFSKSGDMITSQVKNEYTMKQKYNISATDYNYTTVTGTKTFQWCVNGSTNTWVTSKCIVS